MGTGKEMMIRLNAFTTLKPYFKSFPIFRIPLVGDSRSRFQLTRILYDNEVAYAYPYEEYLYFKGNSHKTLNVVKEIVQQGITQGKLILGSASKPELLHLTPRDEVIVKPIVYSAFEKILELREFQVPRRNVKKVIPKISKENFDRELIVSLTNDVVILRGLRYRFEIRPSGYGILWLDIYSPPYNLQELRRMSPREVRSRGLIDQYHGMAALKSKDRLKLLRRMLDILCEDKGTDILTLRFPDGDSIQLSKELLLLELVENR